MKIGQNVNVLPPYAKNKIEHKDSEQATILSISTHYCFVEIQKTKKIEIVENELIKPFNI